MSKATEVKQRIAQTLNIDLGDITDDARLDELVPDSFALVELAIELQEDFDVQFTHDDLNLARTIGDLLELIETKSDA
jgi:acyl carrier protein